MSQGKGFLKVCGIIMIVGGGLSILLSIIALIGLAGVLALAAALEVQVNILAVIGLVLAIIAGVMELVCGIVGVKNCDKPEAAGKCLTFGIIVLATSILAQILTAIGGGNFNFFSMLTGSALPVLFIIGACLNKKNA